MWSLKNQIHARCKWSGSWFTFIYFKLTVASVRNHSSIFFSVCSTYCFIFLLFVLLLASSSVCSSSCFIFLLFVLLLASSSSCLFYSLFIFLLLVRLLASSFLCLFYSMLHIKIWVCGKRNSFAHTQKYTILQ